MQRSLGIFFLGLLLGGLFGYVLHRPGRPGVDLEHSARSSAAINYAARSSVEQKAEDQRILLGDIAAIPFQELYETLSRQRPEDIATLAQQLDHLPPGREKEAKIGAFFKAWAHFDPMNALKAAFDFKTIDARETAIGATISGADATAAASLAESINNLPADSIPAIKKSGLLGLAIGKWAQVDAPAAAEFLNRSPVAGMGLTLAFNDVARNWAASDPEAAMNWAIEHNSGSGGASALSGAIIGWWQKDHAEAEAYAVAHADGPEGKQFVSAIVNEMARQDPHKAADWASKLPTSESRLQSYSMIAMQWAMNEPKAASQWATSLPKESMPAAVDSCISLWAVSDPQAAGQWIGTLDGAARDEAAAAYSSVVAQRDPAAAMTWASSVSDNAVRESALRQVANQWKERDPSAAQTWIQNSSLGETEKARLLATPTPSP